MGKSNFDLLNHVMQYVDQHRLLTSTFAASLILPYCNVTSKMLTDLPVVWNMHHYVFSLLSIVIANYKLNSGNDFIKTAEEPVVRVFGNAMALLSQALSFNMLASVAFAMMPANLYTKIAASCMHYTINSLVYYNTHYFLGHEDKLLNDKFVKNTGYGAAFGVALGLIDVMMQNSDIVSRISAISCVAYFGIIMVYHKNHDIDNTEQVSSITSTVFNAVAKSLEEKYAELEKVATK